MLRIRHLIPLLLLSVAAMGQGVRYQTWVVDGTGKPVPSPVFRVCIEPTSGTPCSGPASIFSDRAMAAPLSNPSTGDVNSNIGFYAAQSRYHLQVSGVGITPFDVPDIPLYDSVNPAVSTCVVVFAATPTFDPATCTLFMMTLGGAVTSSTVSNPSLGRIIQFQLCQDGAGSRTFTWPSNFDSVPVIDQRASKCHLSAWIYNGTKWKMYAQGGDALSLPSGAVIMNGAAVLTLPTTSDNLMGRNTVDTETGKTLNGDTLSGTTTNSGTINGGTIAGATLSGTTTNSGTINGGTVSGATLNGDTLSGTTTNSGTINGGTISGTTLNGDTLSGTTTNSGTINGGTIAGATLSGTTTNSGTINGGTVAGATMQGTGINNSITLLNAQGLGGNLVGTGADVTMYTYTIPANTVGPGKCFTAIAAWQHNSGSASAVYRWKIGGTSLITYGATIDNSTDSSGTLNVCNNAGVQNTQRLLDTHILGQTTPFAGVITTSAAQDFTTAQSVSITMSVANTDTVNPRFWKVTLDQ